MRNWPVITSLVCLAALGCGQDKTAPTGSAVVPPPIASPAAPPPPTSWKVSGHVVASHNRLPVSGATLSLDGIPPAVSAGDGSFSLDTPAGLSRPLTVAADGYQYRETFLRCGEVRSDVDLDLIPSGGSFPFCLFGLMSR